jgi:hypothetical protein
LSPFPKLRNMGVDEMYPHKLAPLSDGDKRGLEHAAAQRKAELPAHQAEMIAEREKPKRAKLSRRST